MDHRQRRVYHELVRLPDGLTAGCRCAVPDRSVESVAAQSCGVVIMTNSLPPTSTLRYAWAPSDWGSDCAPARSTAGSASNDPIQRLRLSPSPHPGFYFRGTPPCIRGPSVPPSAVCARSARGSKRPPLARAGVTPRSQMDSSRYPRGWEGGVSGDLHVRIEDCPRTN